MKALRITLLSLIGIAVIIVAAAAIFVATFDANRYKPEIEQLVLEQTGRTLKIEGDIDLTLWPNIGAELGRTTLSDKDPSKAFVTIDSTRVSVAVMPLLSGQVLVDGVSIDGLTANITRDKGGMFNFNDLLNKTHTSKSTESASSTTAATSPPSTAPTEPSTGTSSQPSSFEIDISSIALTNASISYNDLKNNTDLQLSELNLKTGQIAPQSAGKLELSTKAQSRSMKLDAGLNVTGDYKLDLPSQTIDLTKLSAEVTGNYQDIKSVDSDVNLSVSADLGSGTYTLTGVDGNLKADLAGQATSLTITTDQIKLAGKDISANPSTLKVALEGQSRAIDTELKLPAFMFTKDQLALKKLVANISVTDPALGKEPLKVTANGDLSINTATETVTTSLAGQFDGSPMKLNAGVAGFNAPAITFDATLDQLKLDRFGTNAPPAKQLTQKPVASTNPTATASTATPPNATARANSSNDVAVKATAPAAAANIDLSALKGHNIRGKLRVGKVISIGLTIEQLQADVALAQGKLAVSPHSAQLFGGKLAGSLTVDANTNAFNLKESITGIKLDSLLAALGQDPKVTGQGALTLDLTTSGATVKSIEQNLAGNARVNLKDGAIKGIDIGAILNNVRAMLGKAPTQQGTASGQTTFTELSASATIQKGIATNRDLNVKAPLFRLEGAGTINIPNSSLDYLAKVAVVDTSSGQGGKELASLQGVTIPIKITGKFDNPKYSVDVGSLAAALAKSKLGDKAQEEINKVVPGLGDALKGLFGR